MKKCLNNNGVIIARCWHSNEHYGLIKKLMIVLCIYLIHITWTMIIILMMNVAIIQNERFTHNRLVKISRLFDNNKKDFSWLSVNEREVILINR